VLRDEFSFRCVYCLVRETWTRHLSAFNIDHFQPTVLRPDLELKYENLLYSCGTCNLIKGNRSVPDPLKVLLNGEVHVSPDGMLVAGTPGAARLIDLLDLNGDSLVEFRELVMDIVRLAAACDPELLRRFMGHPSDLPDLATLRPPGGNSMPEGVGMSHFQRRADGSLPETY
jgi:hypothetical protein